MFKKVRHKSLIISLLCLFPFFSKAQITEATQVLVGNSKGIYKAFPFAGGLNAPQFSEADLNKDGKMDLYVFDRVGNLHLAFMNKDNVEYVFAPNLVKNFPPVQNWSMLRDYDGDGVMDLFTYSAVIGVDGISVYKGFYQNNVLNFNRLDLKGFAYNVLSAQTQSNTRLNIYVSRVDFPAIEDIDSDGDLDILSFEVNGGYVTQYKNQSVERGFKKDSLIFTLEDRCWGKFYEGQTSITLSASPSTCASEFAPTTIEERNGIHAGSTLLTLDMDNDGDKELILGDISFNNLTFLQNGGDKNNAFMTSQITAFPQNTTATDIFIFPSAFYLDVTFDGKKDLIATTNSLNNALDNEQIWLYENRGTNQNPSFLLQKKNFLVEEKGMLDFGSGTQPTFVDVNADGLMDIVIGTFSTIISSTERKAALVYLENMGSKKAPTYFVKDLDWLGFSQFAAFNSFSPTFGDIDGDGDLDLFVGENNGQLFYAENKGGAGKAMSFPLIDYAWQNIDVGLYSTPQVVDINGDGLLDFLIGEANGNINYLQNQGTKTKALFNKDLTLSPNTENYGGINTKVSPSFTGYSSPFFTKINTFPTIFTGSENGEIKQFNANGSPISKFSTISNDLIGNAIGWRTKLDMADIDDDGYLEVLAGNFRGGLSLYKSQFIADKMVKTEEFGEIEGLKIYPNPINDAFFNIISPNISLEKIQIFNALGQLITLIDNPVTDNKISCENWQNGVYFLKIQAKNTFYSYKLLKN